MSGATTTMPVRRLTDRRKPHRYTPAVETDIRKTFEKFVRLQRMAQRQQEGSK